MNIQCAAIEFGWCDYRILKPLQGNLKKLPEDLYKKLKKSFEQKGMFVPFFVWRKNDREYYILDGHGREKLFENEKVVIHSSKGEGYEIPCIFLDAKNEKDAKEKLLIINSTYQEFDDFTNFTNDIDEDFIKDVVNIDGWNDITADTDIIDNIYNGEEEDQEIDDKSKVIGDIYELNDAILFERALNKYDIPILKKEMLTSVPEPIQVYCGDGKTIDETYKGFWLFLKGCYHEKVNCTQGILGFYSWDDKFEAVWNKTIEAVHNIKEKDYMSVITPNFTIIPGEPIAWQIWQIYRARWIGRYFQEAGIYVVPDVTWTDERSFDFAFLGIPKGSPCISLQTQNISVDNKHGRELHEKGVVELVKQIEPQRIFIYGSPSNKDYILSTIPSGLPVVWADSWISSRREKGMYDK